MKFVVNLKTAKQIGVRIPPNVLAQGGQSHKMMVESKIGNQKPPKRKS